MGINLRHQRLDYLEQTWEYDNEHGDIRIASLARRSNYPVVCPIWTRGEVRERFPTMTPGPTASHTILLLQLRDLPPLPLLPPYSFINIARTSRTWHVRAAPASSHDFLIAGREVLFCFFAVLSFARLLPPSSGWLPFRQFLDCLRLLFLRPPCILFFFASSCDRRLLFLKYSKRCFFGFLDCNAFILFTDFSPLSLYSTSSLSREQLIPFLRIPSQRPIRNI